jgi:hypothetical protein
LQPTAELRRLLSGKSPRPGSRLSFPEAPAD